jgi:hypothetical protein
MQDCFEIKKSQELIDYLKSMDNKDAHDDFDYQLETNYGFVYRLKNGQVIFLPNNFRNDGLIFKDDQCFNYFLKVDKFPIENPGTDLYDTEIERIKTINRQIDFYHQHLNKVLKFDFRELDQEAAQAYLKKIIGRTIKQLTTNTDLMALIAVFGEMIRRQINGKWVIEKWYGMYNPHFKPRILDQNNMLIFVDDGVLGNVKWKISFIDMILDHTEGVLSLQETQQYHECFVLND